MSWQQLVGIVQEAADLQASHEGDTPVVCPNDGTLLQSGPDGGLFCPWAGDFSWPGDTWSWTADG